VPDEADEALQASTHPDEAFHRLCGTSQSMKSDTAELSAGVVRENRNAAFRGVEGGVSR
jgi:hypothetical protein